MGLDSRDNAKAYTAQDGDTLSAIAERERATGNNITWQDIALFNWGTKDNDEINNFMRDVLGTRLRDSDNNFIISENDEPMGELLIPVKFKKSGLTLNTLHTLHFKKTPEPPKQFNQCCKVSGVTFEFDKSFIRPSVVENLSKLKEAVSSNPDAKIIIFGHTDKVGTKQYNKELSERRAKSTYAFITNDVAIWEELYNQENWGTKAIQEILKDFGEGYDPGPVDGVKGPKTEAAIKKFQGDKSLKVDGVAGPKTREKMFADYMGGKHDIVLTDENFFDPKYIGCGETNPVVNTEEANEENRRVMFYLFDKNRPPQFPCKTKDIAPCNTQSNPPTPRYVESFHCNFYDSIAKNCSDEIKPPPVLEKSLQVAYAVEKCRCGDKVELRAKSKNIANGTPIEFDLAQEGANLTTFNQQIGQANPLWPSKVNTDKRPEPLIKLSANSAGIVANSAKDLLIEKYEDKAVETKTIPCASGVYGWTGKFDMQMKDGELVVTAKIKLVNRLGQKPANDTDPLPAIGAPVSDADKVAMKADIEGKLSRKHILHRNKCDRGNACDCVASRGCCKIRVKVVVSFVESGEHHSVNLFQGAGRANATNWTRVKTRENSYAHETGHLLGWYDEYAGGAVGTAPRWKIQQPVVMNTGLDVPDEYYWDFRDWIKSKTVEDWNILAP